MLKDLWTASEKPAFDFCDTVILKKVVDDSIEQVKEGFAAKGIRISNQVPLTLPSLNVDKPKFHRLFELLLKDEIASLPAGSKVTITASNSGRNAEGKEEVQIEVSDDGPGLPMEALRLVFDPFVVRSDSPVEYGIHLMACYFIVHHHGGKIDARSEQGQGTTFSIRMPVNPAATNTPQAETDFFAKSAS